MIFTQNNQCDRNFSPDAKNVPVFRIRAKDILGKLLYLSKSTSFCESYLGNPMLHSDQKSFFTIDVIVIILFTMKIFPEIVYFRITSKCNNNCKYCYGPQKNLKELNFLRLQDLFHLFYKKGVKAVVLCGGEPLLRNDFEDIIKELKKYNLKIFLDTAGDLFFKYQDIIVKKIDVLGLPIDFPNKSYRNQDNFNNVFKILKFFQEKYKRPIIRIGTVLTKDNINVIEKIGELIKNYPVDIWKIYEFIPIENTNSIKNKSFLEISPERFNETTQTVKKKFLKYFKIVISRRKDRTDAHFLINPNGTVFISTDDFNVCKEINIGDVFDENIARKWRGLISKKNYLNNAKATFDYKF